MEQQLPFKLKILSSLVTKSDLIALEEKLNAISNVFGNSTTNHELVLKQMLDFVTYGQLNEDLQALKLNMNNQTDFENYLDFVQRKIKNFKVLKLITAITPTKETVDEIFYWISNTLGQEVLLDLNTDPSLIGGLVIEYAGKYKDYSFKNRLDNFFKVNHAMI